ncbi:response regulator [archaeon]|jgi:CheY-like chemotaxis protein|nr:response regulator [archaeon]MBT4417088.1 response regulator [archaeon]
MGYVGKALVVDDDITLANTIGDQIGFMGIEPNVRLSAREGLEYWAQDGETGYVVTDLQMPGMDGLDFIRELRAQGYEGKAILISGSIDLREIVERRVRLQPSCKPDAVVEKPFRFGDLQRTLVDVSK